MRVQWGFVQAFVGGAVGGLTRVSVMRASDVFVVVSTKTQQAIFDHASVFALFSPVHAQSVFV